MEIYGGQVVATKLGRNIFSRFVDRQTDRQTEGTERGTHAWTVVGVGTG